MDIVLFYLTKKNASLLAAILAANPTKQKNLTCKKIKGFVGTFLMLLLFIWNTLVFLLLLLYYSAVILPGYSTIESIFVV